MGSKEIENIKYRQSFAFIGTYGLEHQDCNEKRGEDVKDESCVAQMFGFKGINIGSDLTIGDDGFD